VAAEIGAIHSCNHATVFSISKFFI
jgi:hypothetical protein